MKIPLSNRLLACCDYVNQGDRVADIGCDHGYLGIHLLKTGIASHIIASDVNRLPLESAMVNGLKYGVRDQMAFYLSDGARNIPRDFDVLVCAGMGADTMISILSAAPWLQCDRYRLVLQCQSKTHMLRQWLNSAGYQIQRETLAKDGKFVYSIMEVVYAPGDTISPAQCYISRQLIEDASPLLAEYYDRILHGVKLNVEGMRRSSAESLRIQETLLSQLEGLKEVIHGNCT